MKEAKDTQWFRLQHFYSCECLLLIDFIPCLHQSKAVTLQLSLMSVRTSNSQSLVSSFGGQSNEILRWLRRPQQEDCEKAYFKMDNVLIDDRRIHVDFSQSVSKIRWKGKGADPPSPHFLFPLAVASCRRR